MQVDAHATTTNVTPASDWLTAGGKQDTAPSINFFEERSLWKYFINEFYLIFHEKALKNFFTNLIKGTIDQFWFFLLLYVIIFFVKFLVRLRMATRDCDLLLCVIWVVVGLVTIRRNNVKRVVKSWLVTSDCSGIKIRN